jgi:L-threonylcarbamoyladenylate synthase
VTDVVSIERDGPAAAVTALERTVQGGGVAVFPADGLYGLACDPLNSKAIERIHELKGREGGKPSAVMYFSPLIMRELIADLGPRAAEAVGTLLPGPVTVVVANPSHRYPLACRENPDRLGVRLIEGPLAGAPCPVFQTSANRRGDPAPATFGQVPDEIIAGADLAIDGGELTGLASTVIDITAIDEDGSWRILRKGAMQEPTVTRVLSLLAQR